MSNKITEWYADLTKRMQSASEPGTSSPTSTPNVCESITVSVSRSLYLEMQAWAFNSNAFRAARKHALSQEEGAFQLAERYAEIIEDMDAIEAAAKKAGWS